MSINWLAVMAWWFVINLVVQGGFSYWRYHRDGFATGEPIL